MYINRAGNRLTKKRILRKDVLMLINSGMNKGKKKRGAKSLDQITGEDL